MPQAVLEYAGMELRRDGATRGWSYAQAYGGTDTHHGRKIPLWRKIMFLESNSLDFYSRETAVSLELGLSICALLKDNTPTKGCAIDG
jgi:hypothetical protein